MEVSSAGCHPIKRLHAAQAGFRNIVMAGSWMCGEGLRVRVSIFKVPFHVPTINGAVGEVLPDSRQAVAFPRSPPPQGKEGGGGVGD